LYSIVCPDWEPTIVPFLSIVNAFCRLSVMFILHVEFAAGGHSTDASLFSAPFSQMSMLTSPLLIVSVSVSSVVAL
jgi:hypothetical protein